MLHVEQREDILVLRPAGGLDKTGANELERVVAQRLDGSIRRLVLDCSELDCIGATGLRVVLLAGKQLRTKGGTIVFAGVHGMVHEAFEASGMLALFPLAPTLDEALEQA